MSAFFERILAPRFFRWRALLVFCGLAFAIQHQSRVYHLDILLGAKIPSKAVAQVFYSFNGVGYLEENNQVMLVHKGPTGEVTYESQLRTSKPIRTVRLDLSNKVGEVFWSSLTLIGPSGKTHVQGADLPKVAVSYDQLLIRSSDDTGQQMEATTSDPKIFVAIPSEVSALPTKERWLHWLTVLGWSALCVGTLEYLLRVLRREHPLNVRVTGVLERIAERWSEDTTIRFKPSSLMVYVVLLVFAMGWVGLKLNQSSNGVWDRMYPAEFVDRDVDLGTPRAIRSDEWNTMTPWILSQVQSGFKFDNPNLGAPGSAILAGAPFAGPLMIAQPKYWGFLLLDIERGYSWFWAFKSLGMIAAFFTLLLLITKGDVKVSLAGALATYGSSYVQWWLSSVPAEVIAGFSAAVVGSVYLLQARKTGGILFGAMLVAMAIPNLLLHLYPPYLQPLALLAVFLLIGLLANRQSLEAGLERLGFRAVVAVCTLLVVGSLVALWYEQAADTITLMLNTDYPGHRISLGGDFPLSHIFYGVFESWKISDNIPFPPVNPSEASKFWVLFPLAPLLVPLGQWTKPAMRPAVWLMAFCLMAVAWASLPLPTIVRTVMAAAGWYLTPASRVDLGISVASAILMAFLAAAIARGDVRVIRAPRALIPVIAFAGTLAYGFYLQLLDPDFFNLPRISLAASVVAGIAWSSIEAKRGLYLTLAVALALPTLHVNPIQSGLQPYLNKAIFQAARKFGGNDGDLWAVFGSLELSQGFKAAGLNVLNGTHYAPRMEWLDILDPDHKYKQVWNRYAHTNLVAANRDEKAEFKIDFADSYHITVDVCGSEFQALRVTHAAFKQPPTVFQTRCLEPLLTNDASGVQLYKILNH